MFAYIVAAVKRPDPLLEMYALNDVGLPIASFDSKLDGDYL